jgi:hypothetical protein
VDEADIRTVLRDAAGQVRPAQDAPPPQLPQPRRGLAAKLGVVVTSLLIASAGVAIVVVAFLPGAQDRSAQDLPLGAGSPNRSPVSGVDTERAGLEVGVPYRIDLYTHCGIDFWTRFDGSYWDAVGYDNSSGNPPEGLGNPYDHGSMTLLSEKEARYVSQSGKVIRFTRAAERPKGMACF